MQIQSADTPENRELLARLFPFLKHRSVSLLSMAESEMLFSEGQSCGSIGFVLSGAIKVFKQGDNGREITLYRLLGGDACILSILCALARIDHRASGVVEESGVLAKISVSDFRLMMRESDEVSRYVFGLLADRLSSMIDLVDDVVFRKMDQRVAESVLMGSLHGKSRFATTHEALAMELGTAREVVSRILKDFENKGYVRLGRGWVEVVDARALRKVVQQRA